MHDFKQNVDFKRWLSRQVLRGERLGMEMPGPGLPQRVHAILSGDPLVHVSRTRLIWIAFLIATVGAALTTVRQAHAQSKLAFEVATIKPGSGAASIRSAGPGRLLLGGSTLLGLVRYAYASDFNNLELSGGPKWASDPSVTFDVNAQGPATATPTEIKLMLQSLLAERFALKVHTETKETAGYALVPARKDGKLGPGMVEVTGKPCAGATPAVNDANFARCGTSINPFGTRPTTLLAGRLAHLADLISNRVFELGRPVVDHTGLAGEYDISLNFALLVRKPDDGVTPADLLNGPSLATALQEQLGLKLENARVSIETLVIDSAERPGEN